MSGSVNKVILIGNVGADPEIRRTQDGRPIANLRLATSESWKDKNSGERKEKTEWHTVVCFNEGLCKVVEAYVKKGDKVYIEGSLQTRKWQDQSGDDRYSTEIVLQAFGGTLVMLSSPANSREDSSGGDYETRQSGERPSQQASRTSHQRPVAQAPSFSRDMDDDIPFAPEWRG